MADRHLLLGFIEGTTKIAISNNTFNDLMFFILLKARKTVLMWRRLFLGDAVFTLKMLGILYLY